MKNRLLLFAAAMLGIMVASCTKENDLPQTPITIHANYGGDNAKVSYTENGNAITAQWQNGDQLLVIYNNTVNALDLVSGAGTTSATFSGTILGTPAEGTMLVCYVKDLNTPSGTVTVGGDGSYVYTSDAFLGQDGTLAGATCLNLFGGWTRYSASGDIQCSFSINTSMMKFTLRGLDADANQTATLSYMSGTSEVAKATFTVATGDNTIYLSIPAGQYLGQQYIVYSTTNGTPTSVTLSNSQANFTAGETYSKFIDLLSSDPLLLNTPLTLEARQDNVIVPVPYTGSLEYRLNGGSWTPLTSEIVLSQGDQLALRGNNERVSNLEIQGDELGACYVYGNIMSLLYKTNFAAATAVPEFAFYQLFYYANIDLHPEKPLLLPATTLSEYCYYEMFESSHLTSAPELPATTLEENCYQYMFRWCEHLTHAPALPATTLARNCYQNMFEGCYELTTPPTLPATTLADYCYSEMFRETGLTSAPALPATTLAIGCYQGMFYGCESLTTPPALPATTLQPACYEMMFYYSGLTTPPTLPATTLASSCYSSMFGYCENLQSAPALPATTLVDNCYRGMFYSCTSLTTAPVLPATTLAWQCYQHLFSNCSNLSNITCLATNLGELYRNCYEWVNNVSSTGTFTKAADADWGYRSIHAIPNGWTVVDAQ